MIGDDTGSGTDSDADGDPLTVSGFSIAGEAGPFVVGSAYGISGVGSLTVNGDGSFTFVPVLNYNGSVPAVTYTLSDGQGGFDSAQLALTVTPVNDGPVAVDDGPVAVVEDTPVSGNVLGNDSDVDGDPLTVSAFTIAGEAGPFVVGTPYGISGVGTLTLAGDGSFTFTPALNYNGPVPDVTYTADDGQGGTDTGVLSFGSVSPVNDGPVAAVDTGSTPEDTPLVVAAGSGVLANDTDVDGDALSVTQFTDGVTTVAAGGTLSLSEGDLTLNGDGSYTFTPASNYNGPVPQISYTVSDGTVTTSSTLDITVTSVNDGPVAVDDGPVATILNTPVLGSVLTNDFDPDGDPLSVTAFSIAGEAGPFVVGTPYIIPVVGTFTMNSDGTYILRPLRDCAIW